MNILFIILKIIGILLLVLFILIALLIFHPVYYCIKGEAKETVLAKGYVWWLFQIIRLEFEVEDSKAKVRFRIFGFPKVLRSETTDEDSKGSKDVTVAESEDMTTSENCLDAESTDTGITDDPHRSTDIEAQKADTPKDSENENKTEDRKDKKKKTADRKKTAKGNKDKISDLKKTFDNFKNEISDDRNKLAVSKLYQELLYLLSHLKPKYIKADISFSTGDPALTGQVTGILSLLSIIYRYDAHIYPDFEADEFYVRGNLALKGHMALYHILRSGIHILRDKNIRRLWNKLRK